MNSNTYLSDENYENDNSETSGNIFPKIVGLNVNGLRSKLSNGIFDAYASNFDVICLSETKVANSSDIDLSDTRLKDYHCYIKEKTIKNINMEEYMACACLLEIV